MGTVGVLKWSHECAFLEFGRKKSRAVLEMIDVKSSSGGTGSMASETCLGYHLLHLKCLTVTALTALGFQGNPHTLGGNTPPQPGGSQ